MSRRLPRSALIRLRLPSGVRFFPRRHRLDRARRAGERRGGRSPQHCLDDTLRRLARGAQPARDHDVQHKSRKPQARARQVIGAPSKHSCRAVETIGDGCAVQQAQGFQRIADCRLPSLRSRGPFFSMPRAYRLSSTPDSARNARRQSFTGSHRERKHHEQALYVGQSRTL